MTGDGTPRPAARGGGPPGSAVERTTLAWLRTALSCAGLAAVAVRLADHRSDLTFVLALGALVAMPGLAATWWRFRDLSAPAAARLGPRRATVAALAGTVALIDLAVIVRLVA